MVAKNLFLTIQHAAHAAKKCVENFENSLRSGKTKRKAYVVRYTTVCDHFHIKYLLETSELITPLEAQLLLINGSRELTDVLDGSKCCISLDSVNSADVSTESCWLCVCS
uniref:Uncharacterized protein n=1 Tax=Glossina austeni TaxID=7395 RepID=A0A1A9UPX4_GLOAU